MLGIHDAAVQAGVPFTGGSGGGGVTATSVVRLLVIAAASAALLALGLLVLAPAIWRTRRGDVVAPRHAVA